MSGISQELRGEGLVRTDIHCTECGKTFVGRINFDISGNHIIICPCCGHEHCRVIKNGQITGDRWDSRLQDVKVKIGCVWNHSSLQMRTTTASRFIRERWLGGV